MWRDLPWVSSHLSGISVIDRLAVASPVSCRLRAEIKPHPSLQVLRNRPGSLQIFVEQKKETKTDGPVFFAFVLNLMVLLPCLLGECWLGSSSLIFVREAPGLVQGDFPSVSRDGWAGSTALLGETLCDRYQGTEREWWWGSRAVGEMAGHSLTASNLAQEKLGPWNSKWTCLLGSSSQGSTLTQMRGPGRHSRETAGSQGPANEGFGKPDAGWVTLTLGLKKHSDLTFAFCQMTVMI